MTTMDRHKFTEYIVAVQRFTPAIKLDELTNLQHLLNTYTTYPDYYPW